MKKIILIIASILFIGFIFFLFLAYNFIGAGTIGSIETYQFNTSRSVLDSLVLDLANKNDNITYINSNDYFDTLGYEDPRMEEFRSFYTDFEYLSIKFEENELIFRYETIEKDSTTTKLILISAAKFGESIQFESKLWFFERNKYRNTFDNIIIDKLNKYKL